MDKDLMVFRSAHKEKETIGMVVIISEGHMQCYNSRYNYRPFGQYSVQTDSIFYNTQIFLKSTVLIEGYYD